MSLGRVAELAWALGYEPQFELSDMTIIGAGNTPPAQLGVSIKAVQPVVTTGATVKTIRLKEDVFA